MERYEENSRRTQRVRDVQAVLGYLVNRFNTEPTRSDHFQHTVLERTDLAQEEFIHVTDRAHGWTSEGLYL